MNIISKILIPISLLAISLLSAQSTADYQLIAVNETDEIDIRAFNLVYSDIDSYGVIGIFDGNPPGKLHLLTFDGLDLRLLRRDSISIGNFRFVFAEKHPDDEGKYILIATSPDDRTLVMCYDHRDNMIEWRQEFEGVASFSIDEISHSFRLGFIEFLSLGQDQGSNTLYVHKLSAEGKIIYSRLIASDRSSRIHNSLAPLPNDYTLVFTKTEMIVLNEGGIRIETYDLPDQSYLRTSIANNPSEVYSLVWDQSFEYHLYRYTTSRDNLVVEIDTIQSAQHSFGDYSMYSYLLENDHLLIAGMDIITDTSNHGYMRIYDENGGFTERMTPDFFDSQFRNYKSTLLFTGYKYLGLYNIKDAIMEARIILPEQLFIPVGITSVSYAEDMDESLYVFAFDANNNSQLNLLRYSKITFTDEKNVENEFIIFPNPSKSRITIHLSGNQDIHEKKAYFTNVLGQIQILPLDDGNQIDISSLVKGTYYVRIGDWEQKFTKF